MTAAQVTKLNGISAGANKIEFTIVTGTSTTVSLGIGGATAVTIPISPPAGYSPIALVQFATGAVGVVPVNVNIVNSTSLRIDLWNASGAQQTVVITMRVLCVKTS